MKKLSFRKFLILVLITTSIFTCTGCEFGFTHNTNQEIPSTEFSTDDVIAIAENGFKAMQEKDAASMVEYANMDIFYYAANQKHLGKEELIEAIDSIAKESTDTYNSMGIIGYFAALKNVKFYNVEQLSEYTLMELNHFIRNEDILGDDGSYNYRIEGAYRLNISYDGIEQETFKPGNEPYVLVIYANDEWKLDIFISVMKELYDSLPQ